MEQFFVKDGQKIKVFDNMNLNAKQKMTTQPNEFTNIFNSTSIEQSYNQMFPNQYLDLNIDKIIFNESNTVNLVNILDSDLKDKNKRISNNNDNLYKFEEFSPRQVKTNQNSYANSPDSEFTSSAFNSPEKGAPEQEQTESNVSSRIYEQINRISHRINQTKLYSRPNLQSSYLSHNKLQKSWNTYCSYVSNLAIGSFFCIKLDSKKKVLFVELIGLCHFLARDGRMLSDSEAQSQLIGNRVQRDQDRVKTRYTTLKKILNADVNVEQLSYFVAQINMLIQSQN